LIIDSWFRYFNIFIVFMIFIGLEFKLKQRKVIPLFVKQNYSKEKIWSSGRLFSKYYNIMQKIIMLSTSILNIPTSIVVNSSHILVGTVIVIVWY
jgi:hypothetical protein